jgi:hypothetical protein
MELAGSKILNFRMNQARVTAHLPEAKKLSECLHADASFGSSTPGELI